MIKSDQLQAGSQRNNFIPDAMDDFIKAYKEDEINMTVYDERSATNKSFIVQLSVKCFYMHFSSNWFKVGDIIIIDSNTKLKVLSSPTSRWFLKLLEWIICLHIVIFLISQYHLVLHQ